MDSAWEVVLAFRSKPSPSAPDFLELDKAMDVIRRETNMETHLVNLGYSQQFCRFKSTYDGFSDKETLQHLKRHCTVRARQVGLLRRRIEELERSIQKECQHTWEKDWEARDHRSRYYCPSCGAYR